MPATVHTHLLHRDLLYQAYDAIREALICGRQAYVICPLIAAPGQAASANTRGAGSGKDSAESGQDGTEADYVSLYSLHDDQNYIAAAEAEVQMLRRSVFNDRRIELMTSRLSDAEKKEVMEQFRAGEIDILVSTTVIEVGIDVANATVMVILDADRFGLAQLHQLRGRVGRGQHDGHVFLVQGSASPQAQARLRILETTSDGLQLAEMDLRLRHEGDVAGLRQHGKSPLKLVNVIRDAELISRAHNDAQALLAQDPNLTAPEHKLLRQLVGNVNTG
jgi:ATP-dependent DNA helicase RecG